MNQTHILSLNFENSWRGGENQTLIDALGLIQRGFNVHLICKKGSALEKRALEKNLKVFSKKTTLGVLFFLICNARKYNLLHAQGSSILTYCILSKPFHQAKIIFTRRINIRPSGRLTRIKYRLCDRIVAVSRSVKNIVSEFSSRNDIQIISDAVIFTPPSKMTVQAKLNELNPQQKKIIGTIAALTPEKNPSDNIDMVRIMKEKRDDFIFLHFGEGVMKDDMQQRIKKYNLQDTYFLMGFVDNVNDYLATLNVFVMTSSNEGLCSSVLDAFMYKVPVVSTNAGGLYDLLEDGRGIACEVGKPVMIAEGVDHILNHPSSAQLQVEKAYNYVLQHHSIEYISNQYTRLIKDLFSKKNNV
jgi:glycosyltransferase involved in cell wall biosynthesis